MATTFSFISLISKMGKVPGGGFTDACKQQLLNWNSRRLNHGLSGQSEDNAWGNKVEGFFKPPSQ